MLPLPDARKAIKKAIKKYPHLLKDSSETEYVVMKLMIDFKDECKAYVEQDLPLINAIKEQLSILNNLT